MSFLRKILDRLDKTDNYYIEIYNEPGREVTNRMPPEEQEEWIRSRSTGLSGVDITLKEAPVAHNYDEEYVVDTSEIGEVDHTFDPGRRILYGEQDGRRVAFASLSDATTVSSATYHGTHRPVIDIDVPIRAIPSSTPGHNHLYIDADVTWCDYLNLLEALERCRLVERGYIEASKRRGGTHVRLPWVKKKVSA